MADHVLNPNCGESVQVSHPTGHVEVTCYEDGEVVVEVVDQGCRLCVHGVELMNGRESGEYQLRIGRDYNR